MNTKIFRRSSKIYYHKTSKLQEKRSENYNAQVYETNGPEKYSDLSSFLSSIHQDRKREEILLDGEVPVGSRHSNIAYHTEQLGTLWRKGGPWGNVIEQKLEIEGNSEINFNNLAEHSISQFFDQDFLKLPDEENEKLEYLQELQEFFSSKLNVTTAQHTDDGRIRFSGLRIFDSGKIPSCV